jgi:hypothetical protein
LPGCIAEETRDARQKNKGSQSITIKSGKTRKKYEEIIKELEWDVRSTLTQRSTNIIKYTQQQRRGGGNSMIGLAIIYQLGHRPRNKSNGLIVTTHNKTIRLTFIECVVGRLFLYLPNLFIFPSFIST